MKNLFRAIWRKEIAFGLIGLAALVLLAWPLWRNLEKRRVINQELRDLETEITSLEQKNGELGKALQYLGTEQYVEEQARLNLGLKKPGEEVAVISDAAKPAPSQVSVDQAPANAPHSNPEKWRRYFFHN